MFLLRPPDLLRRGPFSERENVCNSQENGVRTRHAAIVNHRALVKILRVVNLLRVVFLVRRGPLGIIGSWQNFGHATCRCAQSLVWGLGLNGSLQDRCLSLCFAEAFGHPQKRKSPTSRKLEKNRQNGKRGEQNLGVQKLTRSGLNGVSERDF